MKKVIVIVGPTASGKTKYSIELAKAINSEVINGDSVQVYKELNIGSAKIHESEMEGIPHHLFDVVNVGEEYTAFDFQKDARKLIDQIKHPIIVGGTGFYIKSALYDYEFNKEENNESYDNLTNEELYNELIKLDPKIDIDKDNRVRLVRGLNLAKSGHLRSEKKGNNKPLYNYLAIYLDIDREILKKTLIKRLEIMFESGLIEEVKQLKEQGHYLNTIGYREVYKYLDNEYSLEQTKNEIIKSSMRLAKKQKTWFKNQMNCLMVNPLDKETSNIILKEVKKYLGE